MVEKGQGSGGDGGEIEADDVRGSYGFDVEKQTISIINIMLGEEANEGLCDTRITRRRTRLSFVL